jgi:hypothetical protein
MLLITISGIADSNPDEDIDVSSVVFAVFCAGSAVCDGPITYPEESYRVCVCVCVCVCVIVCNP